MPVIPFIPAIAGAVGGYFSSRGEQNAAGERSPEETTALQGGQQSANTLGGMGKNFFTTGNRMITAGQKTLEQPTSYYQRLLSGNRATMSQAVSQPRAAISDVYRGAERGLERGGVRGAARDVATGELSRQRAGQISSLITGVQPGAAQALTDVGQTQTSQGGAIAGMGTGAVSSSGNIFASLLGQGANNRMYARQEGQNAGANYGALIFDLLSGAMSKRGGSGASSGAGSVAGAWG